MGSAQKITLKGRKVVGGVAEGEALVTEERISGWGGIDPRSGTVIETRHELRGKSFAGRSRYTPPGRPDTAARIARAMPTPMSSACSTRKAALHSGLAIASWSISS